MLPHSHFIISGLAAVPIAAVLSPEKPIIEWALISGLLSSAIDLDVYTLVLALLFYFLFPAYFIPAAVGVVTHILSDIPNLRRLVKK
jgi:hypothetical protein